MSAAGPYRVPPTEPPARCERCGDLITLPASAHEDEAGEPICRPCFIQQYDLLALFGVGAATAGALTSSAALLVCGVLVPALGAYAIYKKGI